jgi:hypothetical protein
MQLRIWKTVYLCPWIRLNIFNRGISVSLGDRNWGWVTIGRRGVRETLDIIPGVYLTENQPWGKMLPRRKNSRP